MQSPANSATFWYLILSSEWFKKSTKNIFRPVCFSGNQKLALKRQLHEICYLRFFFMNPNRIARSKKCKKIAEMRLLICGLEVADIRKNCDCGVAVAERHFFKKLRNCDCESASFKLRNCDCGLKKKLRMPTSAYFTHCYRLFLLIRCKHRQICRT